MARKYLILHRNQEATARQVYEYLRNEFGAEHVHLGLTVPLGADIKTVVRREVAKYRAVIVIIDSDFTQKLDNSADIVRVVLDYALPRWVLTATIPLLMDGATLPAESDLPPSMSKLALRQPASTSDLKALVDGLKATEPPASLINVLMTDRRDVLNVMLILALLIAIGLLLVNSIERLLVDKPTTPDQSTAPQQIILPTNMSIINSHDMTATAIVRHATQTQLELTATAIVRRATENANLPPTPTLFYIEEVRPVIFQTLTSVVFDSKREHALCGFSKGIVIIGVVPDSSEVARYEAHTGAVQAVAYGPDDTIFASASDDGQVLVWSTETGEVIQTFLEHGSSVLAVAIHPDGQRVVSGGRDNRVRVWNIETGEQSTLFALHDNMVLQVAISPDGQTVASAGLDGMVYLWDIDTGEVQQRFSYDVGVYGLLYSPDGALLALGFWDSAIEVRQVETEDIIYRMEGTSPSRGPASALAFSSDNRLLAQSTYSGAFVHNLVEGGIVELRRLPESSIIGTVEAVAFADNDRTVYLGSNNGIREFRLPTSLPIGE